MATEGAVWQRLEAIVLAAGAGSRFGGRKLLAPLGGGVLLDGALAAAFASAARTVAVVWGADAGVPEAATAFAERTGARDRLRLVRAARHAEGLSASLAAGVASLPADGTGVFVFLGDMPCIPAGLTTPMAEAMAAGASAVATAFEGRRGHPVLFASALWPLLLELQGDRGAGALLASLGEAVALIAAPDDGVLYDVDRPADLAERP